MPASRCPACHGHGQFGTMPDPINGTCLECRGVGTVPRDIPFRYLDEVSWDVGSDRYTGFVAGAWRSKIHVTPHGPRPKTITFTRRQNGGYYRLGQAHSLLSLGGEAHRDPHF